MRAEEREALRTGIVYVNGDDWVALYLNGTAVNQGHEIRIEEAIQVGIQACEGRDAAVEPPKYHSPEPNMEWLRDTGSFPENIDDVVWHDEPYESTGDPDDD